MLERYHPNPKLLRLEASIVLKFGSESNVKKFARKSIYYSCFTDNTTSADKAKCVAMVYEIISPLIYMRGHHDQPLNTAVFVAHFKVVPSQQRRGYKRFCMSYFYYEVLLKIRFIF